MFCKMTLFSFCLTFSPLVLGQTPFENIYATAHIDEHIPEFLAMEINHDFKESIKDYNLNRKNPRYFIAKIKDEKLAEAFSITVKKIALPEIRQLDHSEYYFIEAGNNRIEFSTALFLRNKYLLNGVEKTINREDFISSVFVPHQQSQKYVSLILSHLISEAIAEEDEDFKASYKNLDTTKILMASIIALDSSFKERSLLDKIPFSNDVADTNLKNLVKKLEVYQNQCEENLELQERIPTNNYQQLGGLERYSLMNKLRETADPSYQSTLNLIKKMSSEQDNYSTKRNTKLVDNFNLDKKAAQCEAMLKPLISESKSRTNAIAAYLDGGNSENVAFQKHPCTKMANLKICLSKFATKAAEINDLVRKNSSDAKESGVQPYSVPKNFPAENISR